ncbi:HAD-IIB family hydrolase [Atopobium fossor]|uniref:HAD-IIB family hydrolase n=1 Tax=Atopobium fossor TaxID=39487 RepID=UPI00042802F4|nr:HAD family hydrolase [Atopobium fossor]
MIKLILSDIDGTILPYGQKHVSANMLDAIHTALDAGIRFGPCTGRGVEWLAPLFCDDATAYATAIGTNGQSVYLDGQALVETRFTRQLLQPLVDELSDVCGAGVLVFMDGVPHVLCGDTADLMVSFPEYAKTAIIEKTIPSTDAMTKCNVFLNGDMDATVTLCQRLNERVSGLDFDVPNPAFLNVMVEGRNKASGIDALAHHLGITLDDVVVFGDGGNDVPMLAHVPNSVAVAGAMEQAAAAARWHTGSVDDDAVADDIRAIACGEWPFTR